MDLVNLIKDSDASDYAGPIHAFTSMCIGLCNNPPPAKQKLPFLNKVWICWDGVPVPTNPE